MRKIITVLLGFLIITTTFGAFPANPASDNSASEDKATLLSRMYAEAMSDGNLTYKEAEKIASEAKGSKLTFKEKLGVKLMKNKVGNSANAEGKSQVLALILCALVGALGIHRFYLGYIWQGVVQLLTLGGCGIWALIDLIRIIMGTLKPKDGEYTTTL